MNNEYELDFNNVNTCEQAHEYIAKMLGFPDYYGSNLDALYDCLTDMPECTIYITGVDFLMNIGDYGKRLIEVIIDGAHDNDLINLNIIDENITEDN